jgi:hypothetical protein
MVISVNALDGWCRFGAIWSISHRAEDVDLLHFLLP